MFRDYVWLIREKIFEFLVLSVDGRDKGERGVGYFFLILFWGINCIVVGYCVVCEICFGRVREY